MQPGPALFVACLLALMHQAEHHRFNPLVAARKIKLVTPCPAIVAPIRTIARIDVGSVGGCAEPAKVTEHNTVKLPPKPGDVGVNPIRRVFCFWVLVELRRVHS